MWQLRRGPRRRLPAAARLRSLATLSLAVALCLFLALGGPGCGKGGGGAAPPPAKGPGPALAGVPWGSGDRAVYDIMVEGNKAGTAVLTAVPGKRDGRAAAVFTNEITVEPAKETTTAWADAASLMALASDVKGETPQGPYTVVAAYGPSNIKIDINAPGQDPQTITRPLPEYCWDNEQFLSAVRALPLAAGYTQKVVIISTKVSVKVEAGLAVEGEETVEVPAGSFDCYKVSFDFEGSKQYGWYSKDAKRLLVKYDNSAAASAFALVETGPAGK